MRWRRTAALAILFALAAVSVAVGFWHGLGFWDFHWESAALFLQGENPYQWFFGGRDFQGVCVNATQVPSLAGYLFFGALLFALSFTGSRDSLLKLSIFAVIANVMFYHRVYDFVTLLFPLIYAVRNLQDRSRLGVALRWAVFANVALVFFGIKALRALDLQVYVPCCAVAEHVLLFLLLFDCCKSVRDSRSLIAKKAKAD